MAENGQQRTGPRPESTIVQSFSADLDSMFGLASGENVGQLEQTVEQKKQTVTSTQQQLEELEAKLRETEHRLAQVSRGNSPARQANTGVPRTSPDKQSQSVPGAAAITSPLANKPTFPADRPPTADSRPQNTREDTANAMVAGMPGGMPQTPSRGYSGSSEYVMVDRNNGEREGRSYGQSVR